MSKEKKIIDIKSKQKVQPVEFKQKVFRYPYPIMLVGCMLLPNTPV